MILGVVMILVVAYVMVVSNPPYGDALVHMVAPEHPIKLILPIITFSRRHCRWLYNFCRSTPIIRLWHER